ncbi:MAG: TIGR01244 family phosphatase [Rhodobacteraceae bacterium]|nr:TIGR01244 family phosphatase [Paracoccaceae bacterium]
MSFVCIDKNYHVSPQLEPQQIAEIADNGFVKIICNRPDMEVSPFYSSSVMEDLAKENNIEFHLLELTHEMMTPATAVIQRELFLNCEGPVLAYCASGTRCSLLWAIGEVAAGIDPKFVLEKTLAAGYDFSNFESSLRTLSKL